MRRVNDNSERNGYDGVFKALGDEHRLQILELLSSKELSAGEILASMDIVQSTLSHHMKVMTDSGVVTAVRSGKWTIYSVNKEVVEGAASFLQEYLERAAHAGKSEIAEKAGQNLSEKEGAKEASEKIQEAAGAKEASEKIQDTAEAKEAPAKIQETVKPEAAEVSPAEVSPAKKAEPASSYDNSSFAQAKEEPAYRTEKDVKEKKKGKKGKKSKKNGKK